jgi:hypothetical protein
MRFTPKVAHLIEHMSVVRDARDALHAQLCAGYREMEASLRGDPQLEALDRLEGWGFHAGKAHVQFWRPGWCNEGYDGVHLEMAHSDETLLDGVVRLVLHVESAVLGSPALWPGVGEEILTRLRRHLIPHVGIAKSLSKGSIVTLAWTDIPLASDWDLLVAHVRDALVRFSPVAHAADLALWHATHPTYRPLLSTTFGEGEPTPKLEWWEEPGQRSPLGGQSLQPVAGGGRALVISRTGEAFNHPRSGRSILTLPRFKGRKAGERLYFMLRLKADGPVSVHPFADGGPLKDPDAFATAWDFRDLPIEPGNRFNRVICETSAEPSDPRYKVEGGGTLLMTSDTGYASVTIRELEFGVIEPVEPPR